MPAASRLKSRRIFGGFAASLAVAGRGLGAVGVSTSCETLTEACFQFFAGNRRNAIVFPNDDRRAGLSGPLQDSSHRFEKGSVRFLGKSGWLVNHEFLG